MPTSELLSQLKYAADQATVKAEEYSGVVGTIKEFIVERFGENGLIAAYILVTVLVLMLVSKVAKFTFSTVKFVVIPSVALAFAATLFLHCSFLVALPVTVTLCSLILLFKGYNQ